MILHTTRSSITKCHTYDIVYVCNRSFYYYTCTGDVSLLGNGGGDQIQVGPSPFASVMGQAPLGLAAAVNGMSSHPALHYTCMVLCTFVYMCIKHTCAYIFHK